MNVRLVQCLCPARHCIMALAYQPGQPVPIGGPELVLTEENATNYLKLSIFLLIDRKEILPACAICGSKDWHYEDSETPFVTLEEAKPKLREQEERNRETAAMLKASRN